MAGAKQRRFLQGIAGKRFPSPSTALTHETDRYAVLLIGREEFIDALELHVVVELAFVQLAPDGALELGIGQLGPIEALQGVRWLWHVLLWQLHFGWCWSCKA